MTDDARREPGGGDRVRSDGRHTRRACLTLDLEPNWDFEDPSLRYATFDHLPEYVDLLTRLDLPLSAFVVGETIEERPDAIRLLRDELDVEFHLHSYSHDISGQTVFRREVTRGVAAFESFFGRSPRGYRATQGRIDDDDLAFLDDAGFAFDSSVFPSYRPGVYSNLAAPLEPYHPHGTDSLLEVPLGVVPGLRIPLALGYVKAVGWPLLAALKYAPLPDVVVFNTHLQDAYRTAAHERLGQPRRFFYGRNMGRAEELFERVVQQLRARSFSFVRMSDVVDRYADRSAPRPVAITGQEQRSFSGGSSGSTPAGDGGRRG